MFGTKAACLSAGGSLKALQPASVPAAASHFPALVIRPAALFPTSASKCFLVSISNGASPSSSLRPFSSRGPICGSRNPACGRLYSVPFQSLLFTAASWPPRRLGRVSASFERIPTSSTFSGDQLCSCTRPCRVLNADANAEVEVEEDELPAEVVVMPQVKQWAQNEYKTDSLVQTEQPQYQEQQRRKTLKNRVVFGLGIGAGFLGIVLAGGWVFTLAFSCTIWYASAEYFDLLSSKGSIAKGMTPPPPVAAKVCSAICSLMPIMTLYYGGRMGVVVTTSAFALATVLLLHKVPRFSQLTSAIFGLIYCGYLPSFWIKLRCGLAVPALNTRIAAGWPILLGGQAHWTVGLVATIISCTAVAAADTFSFLGGKTFGRTPLIAISPKKTLEGAAVGLSCTIAVTILLSKLFQWPSSTPSAAALAILVFMSSLFGDLTESMMKRDAGVKDSGQLIPGHGGILDRVDSYIFTGALVYSFVKIGMPLFGV